MDMSSEDEVQLGRTWSLHDEAVVEELFHGGSHRMKNGRLEKRRRGVHTKWPEAAGGGDDWEDEGGDDGRNGVCFPLKRAPHN